MRCLIGSIQAVIPCELQQCDQTCETIMGHKQQVFSFYAYRHLLTNHSMCRLTRAAHLRHNARGYAAVFFDVTDCPCLSSLSTQPETITCLPVHLHRKPRPSRNLHVVKRLVLFLYGLPYLECYQSRISRISTHC